jgi:alpha-beta hydrolase superfamily lysophospholipase
VATLAVIALSMAVGGALHAMLALPPLHEWHHFVPDSELRAADLGESATLEDLLSREERLFQEVREHFRRAAADGEDLAGSRYDEASRSAPARADRDWNRTFELEPDEIRGGALLVHGLTDAPYSMRSVAARLSGTVPAGLTRATFEDWQAAVRLGARHVRRRIGPSRPLLLVGYSNGGALVMLHAVEQAARASGADVAGVVLISPMIGVSPTARFARIVGAFGALPRLEKARWLDVLPEYNPFKYNSFPINAGHQSYRVSSTLQAAVARAGGEGLARVPPVLAFQSVVDATVSTSAVVHDLFDRLPGSHHRLVVFDVNRAARLEPYIRPEDAALARSLAGGGPRTYRRTLVTNVDSDTLAVETRTLEPGSATVARSPIDFAWPPHVFSLSHVALPFRSDDPLYGLDPSIPAGALALGRLSPRGERAVLTVPIDTLMRIGWNPFFELVMRELESWLESLPPS